MAENSKISWTTHTFNPWRGCTKVSPACTYCYAADLSKRNPATLGVWGDEGTRVIAVDKYWQDPIKWNAEEGKRRENCLECENLTSDCEKCIRPRVFCASLADVFEDWKGPIVDHKGEQVIIEGPDGHDGRAMTMDDVRSRLFDLIDTTPNLDWLLLTKRPENILKMWPSQWVPHPMPQSNRGQHERMETRYRPNVWLGTTVENQEYADKRIPELLKCRSLSPVLFLSCEPLLGPIDLGFHEPCDHPRMSHDDAGCWMSLNWVIAGGESGPKARPSHPDWFESIRDQCKAAGVPFHFKQWGEWSSKIPEDQMIDNNGIVVKGNQILLESGIRSGKTLMTKYGTKKTGRLLDGVLHDEFPK